MGFSKENHMIKLSHPMGQNKETNDLRCQKGTTNFLSSSRRYNPHAYTEEGIITLAGGKVQKAK